MIDTAAPSAPSPVRNAVSAACDRIAPTWPLDQFIAVNPYWGWRALPVQDAAARLGVLAGTTLTMPRSWFREEWQAGRLAASHLHAVAEEVGDPDLAVVAEALVRGSDEPAQPAIQRLATMADLRDLDAGPAPGRTWADLVVHQISQHCAAHFDDAQASWAPDRTVGLFAGWRVDPSVTHGCPWRAGAAAVRARLAGLPESPIDAIAVMLDDLAIPSPGHEHYLTAALASVNGWAAWCAYLRWQARLVGGDDDAIVELLAMRVAWDWLLAADLAADLAAGAGRDADRAGDERADDRIAGWAASWAHVDALAHENADDHRIDWLLQTAIERTYQDTLAAGLPLAVAPEREPGTGQEAPEVQAVFCIDVRSEVFRRALEATADAVQTRGFAGFFGLPLAYTPVGSALTRPQLPGLLAPSLSVSEVGPTSESTSQAAEHRSTALGRRRRWHEFRRRPSSMFTAVESVGLGYGIKLVKESVPHEHAPSRWEHDGLDDDGAVLRPHLQLVDDDVPAAAALAHKVLTAMGLREGFAPLVMLCGHGSHSANNPHAAGLDCGACGGQTGEVNARALADLLNSPAVRDALRPLGIDVPGDTWFVPALHDTTTDTVTLFDTDLVPAAHSARVAQLAEWLSDAGDRARAERADALGLGHLAARPWELQRAVAQRANDWSQVRPEWGLAGNAAFVVAPRWRTRHLDLQGRCFLHDYDWRTDTDLSVLTLIMTAPMVVTNWINLQYHASTVDNHRYGSGNKVLHNVVGGTIGVFEGNGGDLRIGLSMQSLHDGSTLRHRPLRLSVFIEAPRDSIDSVIAGHAVVRDLVLNGWLHLLRIDPDTGEVERRSSTGWTAHTSH